MCFLKDPLTCLKVDCGRDNSEGHTEFWMLLSAYCWMEKMAVVGDTSPPGVLSYLEAYWQVDELLVLELRENCNQREEFVVLLVSPSEEVVI